MPYNDSDEYLVHQAVTTLDEVTSPDRHWTDRFFFSCHAPDGTGLFVTGFGVFPNRREAVGYARVGLADGRHWDLLASRPLEDRADTSVGPLAWRVEEPRRRWRLTLGPNPSALEWDLTFTARTPIWEHRPVRWEKDGRLIVHQQHIQQGAGYEGWIHCGDERIEVDGFPGGRDRTWGIRDRLSVDMWLWHAIQFDDHMLAAWSLERQDGTVIYADGGLVHTDGSVSDRIVAIDHELVFDDAVKRPVGGEVRFTDTAGSERKAQLSFDHPQACVYHGPMLKPSTDDFQWQTWSGTDSAVLAQVQANSYTSDHLMRYEMEGQSGFGVLEVHSAGDGYHGFPYWSEGVRHAGR